MTRDLPRSKNLSNGTIKRRTIEPMEVSKMGGTTFDEKLESPIIGFNDSEKVDDILKKIFLLVIKETG